MKRFAILLSLMVGVWAWSPTFNVETLSLSTSTAHAWSSGSWYSNWKARYMAWKAKQSRGKNGKKGWHSKKGGKSRVPELDPGTAGAAMILLVGGVAYIASRRRQEELA